MFFFWKSKKNQMMASSKRPKLKDLENKLQQKLFSNYSQEI